MKILMVLCFLGVVVSSEEPVPDWSTLITFLEGARARFYETVENDPNSVINETLKDLTTAMGITDELVKNTLERGADLILEEFRVFMSSASTVPSIEEFNQGVCTFNQFPFPVELLTSFPDLTSELNTRVPDLCESLGYKGDEGDEEKSMEEKN